MHIKIMKVAGTVFVKNEEHKVKTELRRFPLNGSNNFIVWQ